MARETECQTPGARFYTRIDPTRVQVEVVLPFELNIQVEEAELLENNLHNAVELVMARYFPTQK